MLFSSFKWMYKLEFGKNLQIFGPKLGILAVYFRPKFSKFDPKFPVFYVYATGFVLIYAPVHLISN